MVSREFADQLAPRPEVAGYHDDATVLNSPLVPKLHLGMRLSPPFYCLPFTVLLEATACNGVALTIPFPNGVWERGRFGVTPKVAVDLRATGSDVFAWSLVSA
jgi:hypothetical protein